MGKWLGLGPDSQDANLDRWLTAEAMVIGRKTDEGLVAVWPQMASGPGVETYAARMNSMPTFVASRTSSGPPEGNATLLDGDTAGPLDVPGDEPVARPHGGTAVAIASGPSRRQ